MEVHKLRLKLGVHEFEAEGPKEYVETQQEMFLKYVEAADSLGNGNSKDSLAGSASENQPAGTGSTRPAAATNGDPAPAAPAASLPVSQEQMRKITSLSGDVITLTAIPMGESSEEDAFLLLLLAHKVLRSVDSVAPDDVLTGMRQSGINVERLDRIARKIGVALVITTGVKRGTKYRLTVPGIQKAKAVTEILIKTVG